VLVCRAHSALNCGAFLHLAVTLVDFPSILSPDEGRVNPTDQVWVLVLVNLMLCFTLM
jgi:hypothetical protein